MPETQAVVEQTDDAQKAVSDEADAQDLNTLLAEYDETSETEEKASVKPEPSDEKELETKLNKIDQVYKMMTDDLETRTQEAATVELNSTVKSINEGLGIDEKFVKAFLNMKASEDPRLKNAYLAKQSNPKIWAAIEVQLRNELRTFASGISDEDATDTHDAIVSSVLNSKSTSSVNTEVKFSEMSDVEFEAHKKQEFAKVGGQ